jgi:hypothetical protein
MKAGKHLLPGFFIRYTGLHFVGRHGIHAAFQVLLRALSTRLLKNLLIICALFLLWMSCGRHEPGRSNEKPLARAFGSYLYPSDLEGMLSGTRSAADSERVVNAFIDNWIRNRAIAHKAELNLSEEEKNVQQQLDEYRNSLLIHRYETKLISERLDTIVTENQLTEYYDQNKNNFELKKNLVQISFVKIEETSPVLPQVKKLFRSSQPADKEKLTALCGRYANNSFLDDEVWLEFNEIIKELPIQNYDQEHFLRNNKFLEIKEGNYIYLINIKAYRTRNSVSAIAFERDNIRAILLNKRKLELLKQMEIKVMKEAGLNKDIEKYRE